MLSSWGSWAISAVLSFFKKIYMVRAIYSVAQEYRSVLCGFTFMLASWQRIVSLFQPCIYTANWHLSARGVRRVTQTQHSLALKKGKKKKRLLIYVAWKVFDQCFSLTVGIEAEGLLLQTDEVLRLFRTTAGKKPLCVCAYWLGFKGTRLGISLWKGRERLVRAHISLWHRAGRWLGTHRDIERDFGFCSLKRTKISFPSFSHLVLHAVC